MHAELEVRIPVGRTYQLLLAFSYLLAEKKTVVLAELSKKQFYKFEVGAWSRVFVF